MNVSAAAHAELRAKHEAQGVELRAQKSAQKVLHDQVVKLTQALLHATAQSAKQTALIEALTAEVAKQSDRIEELLAIVNRKKRRRSEPKEKAAEPEPAVELSPEQQEAYDNRPTPPELPDKQKKPRKERTSFGRNKLPDHLERDEHHLKPSACTKCGGEQLVEIRRHIEEKLDVVKAHTRVRRTVRVTCECHDCCARFTPEALPSPFSRSKATCEWLAWFIWERHAMLVPMDRIRRNLLAKHIPLAMSYLVSQVERVADILAPIDGEHWKQIKASPWMAMDMTGLKVLIKDVGAHNGYLEAFRTDDAVVMNYEPTKGAEALLAKLDGYKGVIVADAEHRHNQLFGDDKATEAGCNAHGRRKLRDAESTQPKLAKDAAKFISAVYIAEAKAKELGLTGSELLSWRQQHCRPHFDNFKKWASATAPTLLPDDPLRKVINYYTNHWAALTLFLERPEIPIDNSATERIYQDVAKLRNNVLFAGSTEGAHRLAVILGIVASCKLLGIDGEAYLGWVLTRLGTHRKHYNLPASQLTPAAYAASLRA